MRLKYSFGGKERRLILGSYPDVSLRTAREMREEAKAALRIDRDPALERRRAAQVRKTGHEDTFEKFAREWRDAEVEVEGGPHQRCDHVDEARSLSGDRRISGEPDRRRPCVGRPPPGREAGCDRDGPPAASACRTNLQVCGRCGNSELQTGRERQGPAARGLAEATLAGFSAGGADQGADPGHRPSGASPVNRLSSRFLALTAQRPGMVRNIGGARSKGSTGRMPPVTSRGRFGANPTTR